jgi:nucleoside-diphosphate-sugar epimerase
VSSGAMPSETQIVVTGAGGQIGSELTVALRQRYGVEAVLATDLRNPGGHLADSGPFRPLDVTDRKAVFGLVTELRPRTIYHLAAILSGTAEKNPALAWAVNMDGLMNVLDAARDEGARVFWPSSIGVYGPETPREHTPQLTIMRPKTVYGISKLTGELIADYYHSHWGVDLRGVRYPGVISAETLPGGGTTDWSVEMFYAAVRGERYTCFVREDTTLPMIYMPDCVRAALDLMEADASRLRFPSSYNLTAMSLSAGELAAAIREHVRDFEVVYEPDFRQAIADSWPNSIDDSDARRDWDWEPRYRLPEMVLDMLEKLRARHAAGEL